LAKIIAYSQLLPSDWDPL